MRTRALGDAQVSALGLGGMPLSRPGRDGTLPDPDRAIATVHAALDLGVTLIDTADCYGPDDHPRDGGLGHNEEIVARALRGRPEEVLVATKGGIRRDGADWPIDGRPAWIHEAVRGSLRRLGVETIDLYQHHRPDPEVPYAETMGAFKGCTTTGWCAGSASRTPTPTRSRWPTRCSARRWSACRTSTPRRSAAASGETSCAGAWAWPSCRGARWAG